MTPGWPSVRSWKERLGAQRVLHRHGGGMKWRSAPQTLAHSGLRGDGERHVDAAGIGTHALVLHASGCHCIMSFAAGLEEAKASVE